MIIKQFALCEGDEDIIGWGLCQLKGGDHILPLIREGDELVPGHRKQSPSVVRSRVRQKLAQLEAERAGEVLM